VPFARDSYSGRVWIGAGQYTDFIRRW
jgi:hypothetical protein